jgi:putative PIN family toxin of toxin-antitoxin system
MQKVILDTNVLVSSLIQRSYPYLIVYELFIENKIQVCVSEELMLEYYDVLRRPKFARFQDFFAKAEALLVSVESKSKKYSPQIQLHIISHQDDNKLFELAEECLADFIITGNTNDFTFPKYNQTRIVSPRDYWLDFQPGRLD